MLESRTVRGQNWKLFLASCALAPGFDQRDFTARSLGELLSGNREWALKTCLSCFEGYFRLALLRACLLSCEEDPKEKSPCYDFTVISRSTTKGQRKKSSPALTPLKMHFTFDFTLDLQAISRTLNYAISQHLLFSSAFGESKFWNLHLHNMCNTDSELDQRRDENCMGLEIYEIAIMSTRPVHKNLFFGNSKKVDKKTNVGKGVLLKYRSFIKF